MMFCSFAASPRIMRWYCQGRVIEVDHPEYFHWLAKMAKKEYPSMRAIILLEVFKGRQDFPDFSNGRHLH